ncbi:MAG: hypothetical protein E6K59_02890 [Nitrospirae bacterium]|nr:MAG: hypothetical protein E6K59_02890 [Nitrospirota bacterium]
MTCRRCHGLMVADYYIDLLNGGEDFWLRAWRCVNCGEVVEPGIIRHRLERRSLLSSLAKRWPKTARKEYEVIALGI